MYFVWHIWGTNILTTLLWYRHSKFHNRWQAGMLHFLVDFSVYIYIYIFFFSSCWLMYFISLQIPLSGPNSIIGRAVVVHADPDDLGKGNYLLTLETILSVFFPPRWPLMTWLSFNDLVTQLKIWSVYKLYLSGVNKKYE